MHIKEIYVSNFRGLDIDIKDLSDEFLIIGQNDAGKSNLCYALRKILDYNIRKIPLRESDSSNHNKEEIHIKICLTLENLTPIERASIGEHIDKIDDKEYLFIELEAIYSDETLAYDETLIFGKTDPKKKSTNNSNELDKILNIIYIEPNYNFEKNKNNFFKFKKKENDQNDKFINQKVYAQAESMNNEISNDDIVEEMKEKINGNKGFEEIFEDMNFVIESNIDIANIYTSLEIKVKNVDGKEIGKMGDGKEKTLAMLLQKLSYDNTKKQIIIVEEPENHMYPLLQKTYAQLINSLGMEQIIFTSHSPYIFDLKKMKQIVRLIIDTSCGRKTTYKSLNISEDDFKKFGYMLNEEIAEIFFYDTVLLVEGLSEKYFYNSLLINDDSFRQYLQKNHMGIFNIMGIDFGPIKELLTKLGIKVLIKTDNDIFKVPNIPKKRYAGLERVINCVSPDGIKEICSLLN